MCCLCVMITAKTVSKIAFTSLCNVDPMLEDIKIQVRCISIWRSHAPNMSHSPWSLDFVVQDEQVLLLVIC